MNIRSPSQLKELDPVNKILKYLNQCVPVLIGVFIFFNPFPHTTTIKEICFYSSVFIVLVLVFFKRIEFSFKTPLTLPFALFVFWASLGLFSALDKQNSIHDLYSHFLRYIIVYFILINFFNSKKRLIQVSWIIIISVTLFAIGGMFYYYFILDKSILTRFAVGFPEIKANRIGVITIFAMILAWNHFLIETDWYRRTIPLVCCVPLLTATTLPQARATVIALFVSLTILFVKNKRFLIPIYIVLLIIVFITPVKNRFTIDQLSNNIRINQTMLTYEIIKDYPIFGIGFGGQTYGSVINRHEYNERLPDKYKLTNINTLLVPHSLLFDIAVRTGLIGFVFYIYIIFVFCKMCWKSIKHGNDDFIKNWGLCLISSFSVFFIIGLFEPVLTHVTEAVPFLIFSMASIIWRLNEKMSLSCQ